MRGQVAALFRSAGFRRVWASGVANGATRWLEFTAVALFVFQQTGSPFLTALTATLRLVPMALFGPVMGILADALGARRVYLGLTLAMVATFAVQAGLALTGRLDLWVVLVGCFVSGVYWSTDFPVRRTLLGAVTGEALAGPALIQDSLANNVTRMLGPMLGGVLLSVAGIAGVMIFGGGASVLAFALVLRLKGAGRVARPATSVRASPLDRFARDLREGLRIARTTPAALLVLAITIVFSHISLATSRVVAFFAE